ncbi:hypothetical protein C8D87_11761 [Lentzea atacamensis]|uniref:Excreted virulence factor EspC, type VII ESX diderm n=1 Tax=Lentzea atacamensis TaxID=531938 RepID=A0ABX9DY72_9PSEU|nr:hypothetical protein [Lentzea atacamensis]RAS58891.1 hypothetical protein C8D87_11761 [Lentzea atacamensis]
MPEIKSIVSPLAAFRLAEEQACAGYLKARKSMLHLATQVASISQLVRERPGRADYRAALGNVMGKHLDAQERTRLAYSRWQRAQRRADAFWSAANKAGAPVSGVHTLAEVA